MWGVSGAMAERLALLQHLLSRPLRKPRSLLSRSHAAIFLRSEKVHLKVSISSDLTNPRSQV